MVQYEIDIPRSLVEIDSRTGACSLQAKAAFWCQRMCLGSVNLIAMTSRSPDTPELWEDLRDADFSLLFDNPRDAAFFKLNFIKDAQ